MSWVKLSDDFDEHPVVQLAGEEAAMMFLRGLCYCNRRKTLGFIPDGKVSSLTPHPHWRKLVESLLTCGDLLGEPNLWEQVPGGYLVVNYAKYQLTTEEDKKQASERTERLRELGRKGGQATQKKAPHVASNLRRSKRGTEADTEAKPKRDTEAPPEAPPEASSEAARFDNARSEARSGDGSAARSPDPVPVILSRAGERAHADATRTSGLEADVDDATTRHDGGARAGGGAGARMWTGADLDAAWRELYRRPTGSPGDVSQLAGLVREAAELRGEQPAELCRRFLDEFRVMLGEWKGRNAHHGTPQVTDAIKHFGKVLDRLDSDDSDDEPEQPDNPAHRRLPTIVRPSRKGDAA